MLEMMYDMLEDHGFTEAESVKVFSDQYVQGDAMESLFNEAIRDSQRVGFREGMKMALTLFAEVQ